jgi:hypothetical protein
MKKPDWFELTKDDQPMLRLKRSKAPLIVFIVIGLAVSLFLIVPPNTGNSPADVIPSDISTPTAEATPEAFKPPAKPTIKNPSIGVMPSGNGEDEDDDGEEEDDD